MLGMARNKRLERVIEPTLERLEERCARGSPARIFKSFDYRTRRAGPVTSRGRARPSTRARLEPTLRRDVAAAREASGALYEELYCARGEMENRIKEQQLDLFAARTSGRLMRVNQVRLWLSAPPMSASRAAAPRSGGYGARPGAVRDHPHEAAEDRRTRDPRHSAAHLGVDVELVSQPRHLHPRPEPIATKAAASALVRPTLPDDDGTHRAWMAKPGRIRQICLVVGRDRHEITFCGSKDGLKLHVVARQPLRPH